MKYLFVFLLLFKLAVLSDEVYADNKIVLSGANWEPYMGDTPSGRGFFAEIASEALKTRGYDVEIQIVPWMRALAKTEEGMYSGIIGASFTEERSEFLSYPESSWEVRMSFFSLKGKNVSYRSLEMLCPARIGVIRGSYVRKRLESVKCIRPDLLDTVESGIKMLLKGRIDFYLESEDNVYYYLNKLFSDRKNLVDTVSPPFDIDKIYTAFSRKSGGFEKLTHEYDKGIMQIKENGVYNGILKKYGIIQNPK